MKLLILKTNIKSKKKVRSVRALLNKTPRISDWSVDLNDIDKVLRIEADDSLEEKEVIGILKHSGLYAEAL